MPIYKEKEDKISLELTSESNKVFITVDCYSGTLISLSFDVGTIKTIHCGDTEEIGDAEDLKNKSPIKFVGSASNPEDDNIEVKVTFFDDDDNSVSYTFPDEYTGLPEYENSDKNPTYQFTVIFG